MKIKKKELMKRTGLTDRQLDYWCRQQVIIPIGAVCPGSGFRREFDEDVVDRVRLLVKLSKSCNQFLSLDILKRIYACYEEGYVDLGDGLVLSWKNSLFPVRVCCGHRHAGSVCPDGVKFFVVFVLMELSKINSQSIQRMERCGTFVKSVIRRRKYEINDKNSKRSWARVYWSNVYMSRLY